MKKFIFLLLLFAVASCKDKSAEIGANRADGFVGVYYTNPVKDNRSSFYVWMVTRQANNRLGLGFFIEDTYRLNNQGTTSKKREVFFLDNVIINGDSAFTINESAVSNGQTVRITGNGKLVTREDGTAGIDASIDYVGADNVSFRSSDQVYFEKVSNVLDDKEAELNDFDYQGNYWTELPEGSKTTFHDWAITSNNPTSFSIDYRIRDKYNQGTIPELINKFILKDAKRVGNRSISVDMTIKEENSGDQYKIRALGNKLLRSVDDVPRIAVVVQVTNETKGIFRIEYLELKKQM